MMFKITDGKSSNRTRGFVVCSNPRSGSTYLIYLAKSTGKLGIPYEWLRGDGGTASSDYEHYPQSESEQVRRVLTEGRTPNGVYSLKMFPEHFDQRTKGWATSLPDLRYVYLAREDIVDQAISLAIARQTGSYMKETPERAEPVYDCDQILNCLRFIAVGEARWRMFFAANAISPLEMSYNQLLHDPQKEISRIAQLVDVEDAIIDSSKFLPTPQTTERNAGWRKRFLEDSTNFWALPSLGAPTLRDTFLAASLVAKTSVRSRRPRFHFARAPSQS